MEERINHPISTAELERRWKAVRTAMEEQKIDVLVAHNNNDHMGGYVRYFTDIPAVNGYAGEVVFPRDDLMTAVRHGNFNVVVEPGVGDPAWRGVKKVMTTGSFASAHYTREYEPELAAKALEPYKNGTIGLVGTHMMSYAFADYLKRHFPNARFVEASELVDQIKVVKSDEELECCAATAKIQDEALATAFAQLKPGMSLNQLSAIAQCSIQSNGGEMGIYNTYATKPGIPAHGGTGTWGWHFGAHKMEKGDLVYLLVETNGPGGYYCEIGRWCSLGPVTQEMQDGIGFAAQARRFTLDLLKPGAKCSEIWKEYNAFMNRHGYPGDNRIFCHGQGYELVERPLIRFDETMEIKKGMNIVCHPGFKKDGIQYGVCDNYFIGSNGPGERVHQFPVAFTEIPV